MTEAITLTRGRLSLTLLPALGGAVGALRLGGLDLLRPAPPSPAHPTDCACFPLVPFANRIAQGRFEFEGIVVQLPAHPGEPHALHGDGWRAAWRCEQQDSVSATLAFHHPAAAWPWPYTARQHFALLEDGLAISLSLTNTGDSIMPAGLGLHPYFPRTPQSRLTAPIGGVWQQDAQAIAARRTGRRRRPRAGAGRASRLR